MGAIADTQNSFGFLFFWKLSISEKRLKLVKVSSYYKTILSDQADLDQDKLDDAIIIYSLSFDSYKNGIIIYREINYTLNSDVIFAKTAVLYG